MAVECHITDDFQWKRRNRRSTNISWLFSVVIVVVVALGLIFRNCCTFEGHVKHGQKVCHGHSIAYVLELRGFKHYSWNTEAESVPNLNRKEWHEDQAVVLKCSLLKRNQG